MSKAKITFEIKTVDKDNEIAKEYECAICLFLVHNPLVTPCQHIYCSSCLQNVNKCPVDNRDFKLKNCKPLLENTKAYRVLSSIKVYCPSFHHIGCDWKITYGDAENHVLNNCTFFPVKCLNKKCKIEMKRGEVKEHESKCRYQVIKCEYCDKDLIRKSQKSHIDKCQKAPMVCQLAGCDQKFARENLPRHIRYDCLKCFVSCPLKCGAVIRRDLLKVHMLETEGHLDALLTLVTRQADDLEIAHQTIVELKQKIPGVPEWSTNQVADWLKRNGFDDFIDAFVTEEIDGSMLVNLEEDDIIGWGTPKSRVALIAAVQQLIKG